MSYFEEIEIKNGPQLDAFGRHRVSMPETLFDSKNIYDDPDIANTLENQPLLYDNVEVSGTGTSTTYNTNQSSQTIKVSATTAGRRIRQTFMRFNYQPGKSQQVNMSFLIGNCNSGNTKREGYFDDKNGIFLEASGSEYKIVQRSYTTGTAVDTAIAQSNWNYDKLDGTGVSGVAIDFTKTQILFIDLEWLGVGDVRVGFVIDNKILYVHTFHNANTITKVYMTTPNLPLRSEISNDGTGIADELTQICSTVISEGGSQELGSLRYASTAGAAVSCTTENLVYAVLGMRLKSNYIGCTIKQLNMWMQIQSASDQIEWILKRNPTVAGTFSYTGRPQSAAEIALGASANTVTGGYDILGGSCESGGTSSGSAGSTGIRTDNAIRLGSSVAGVVDTLVLCARPVGGSTSVLVEGGVTWRELL